MAFDVVGSTFGKIQVYDDWIDNFAQGIDDAADHAAALAKSGLSESVYEYVTSLGVASAAEMTFAQKAKLVALSLKEQATAFLTSPLGIATVAAVGIFAIVKAVDAYNQALQESVNAAKEAASTWTENTEANEDYITRVQELRTALDSGTMSDEAAYDAKSELYSIQQQLISTYGSYAAGIDLVNGSLAEQISLMESLSAAEANEFLNENRTGVKMAISEMEKERGYLVGQFLNTDSSQTNAIKEIVGKYGEYLDYRTTGPVVTITFKGDATEADEVLNSFMTDLREKSSEFEETGLFDGLLDSTSKQLGSVNEVIGEYKDLYEQSLKAMVMSDPNEYVYKTDEQNKRTATEWLSDYAEAIERYNAALASGDSSSIASAAEEFSVIDEQINWVTSTQMPEYSRLVEDVANQLNTAAIAQNNFSEALGEMDQAKILKDSGMTDIDFKIKVSEDSAAFDDIISKAIECGYIVDDSSGEIDKLAGLLVSLGYLSGDVADSAQEGLSVTASELEAINGGIDSVQSKISSLSSSLSSLRDGSLTLSDVIDLIQEFPELAEYVDLTADGFGDLEAGLEKLLRESPEDLINELQKLKETKDLTDVQKAAIDGLCDSINDMSISAIQDASGEFGVLANAINAATKAKNELDKALSEEEYDEGYDKRVEAFSKFQEVIDAGEYGSKAYSAYKEYFDLTDKSASEVQEWMANNKKYFTEGADGINEFMQAIDSMDDVGGKLEGIASYDSITGEFRYDINRLDEFAEALGWSEAMLQDFINKYRMYCEEWTSRSAEMNQTELINAGKIIGDGNSVFAFLDDLMAYTKMTEDDVVSLVDEINMLRTSQGLDAVQIVGVDQITVTQQMIDNLAATKSSADEAREAIISLSKTDGITFEAGLECDGQSIDEIIAKNGNADAELVTVDIKMNVNGDEVVAEVTTVASEIKAALGDNWNVILNCDDAIENGTTVKTLLESLPENTPIAIYSEAETAIGELQTIASLLSTIQANSNISINTVATGGIPANASGTIHATKGPSLLGDEYSPDGSPKPELVLSDNYAYVAGVDGPEIRSLNDGDRVVPADETRKILSRGQSNIRSIMPRFYAGTVAVGDSSAPKLKSSLLFGSDLNKVELTFSKEADAAIASLTEKAGGKTSDAPPNAPQKDTSSKTSKTNKKTAEDLKAEFDEQYKEHQHLLAMDQESQEDYLAWLDEAYQDYYKKGALELEDYYKYQEEVYQGNKDLFDDYLNDSEHRIDILSNEDGNEDKIVSIYQEMMSAIDDELAAAKDRGLDSNDEYVQELESQWWSCKNAIDDIEDEAAEKAQEAIEEERDAFSDYLNDIEHQIERLNREGGNNTEIINLYNSMIAAIEKQIADARNSGLDDNDEYIQELEGQLWDYKDKVADITDTATDNAMSAVNDLVQYRIKMLKQDLENEIDNLNDKKDALKDFYDEQKEMLQDAYDEKEYLEEQSEKRKAVSDIEAELSMLEFDNSAWAQKRKLELQEELASAQKELSDFEEDKALENAQDMLDSQYENQAEQIDTEIASLEEALNNPEALYNQALSDIQNNTKALYDEMVEYNARYGDGNAETVKTMWDDAKASLDNFLATFGEAYKNIILVPSGGYASGTSNASPGMKRVDEVGAEYLFTSSDGSRYRVFSGGEKVLNTDATNFLYDFATSGGEVLTNALTGLLSSMISFNNIKPLEKNIQLTTGDIVIQGNADQRTVSEIRRAQRDGIDYVLKEFARLNK